MAYHICKITEMYNTKIEPNVQTLLNNNVLILVRHCNKYTKSMKRVNNRGNWREERE